MADQPPPDDQGPPRPRTPWPDNQPHYGRWPPSTTHPLPVEAITGATPPWPDPENHGWYPPSRTHPLPVELIGGGGVVGVPEAPDNNFAYGRRGPPTLDWEEVLPLAGGQMTGDLLLDHDPLISTEAATKQYVDDSLLSLYVGTWYVATNFPDLTQVTPPNGGYYFAITANPDIPEVTIVGLPGIPVGTQLFNTDRLHWSTATTQWDIVRGGRYVKITGDTMTGMLQVNAASGFAAVLNNTSAVGSAEALMILNENKGVTWGANLARIYKRAGTGIVINAGIGNPQPQIEDLNESNRRDILDAVNGIPRAESDLTFVHKAGDTMTGALTITQPVGTALRTVVADAANTEPAIDVIVQGNAGVSVDWSVPNTPGADAYVARRDGSGYMTAALGRFYHRAGGAITLREALDGRQPQIEDQDGTNQRDILDTINGFERGEADQTFVWKRGDTMTGDLTIDRGANGRFNLAAGPTGAAFAFAGGGVNGNAQMIIEGSDYADVVFRNPAGRDWGLGVSQLPGVLPGEFVVARFNNQDQLQDFPLQIARDTGLMSILGPPVAPEHAATKAYVDGLVSSGTHMIGLMAPGPGTIPEQVRYEPSTGLGTGRLIAADHAQAGAGAFITVVASGRTPTDCVLPNTDLIERDILISDGNPQWVVIRGAPQIVASNVLVAPTVAGGANVQAALEGLDTIKVDRAGDTMVGGLTINAPAPGLTVSAQATGPTAPAVRIINVNTGADAVNVVGGGNVHLGDGSFVADRGGLVLSSPQVSGGQNAVIYIPAPANRPLTLRSASGNVQPQIEDNNGQNQRNIIDANNLLTSGTAHFVRKAGDTMTGDLTFNATNASIYFTGGSRIYDWTDKPLTLTQRQGANQQPQIRDFGGGNARDIIDAQNLLTSGTPHFVRKAGDTMSGGLGLGTGIVTEPRDLTRHFSVYRGATGFGYGLSVSANRLNIVASDNPQGRTAFYAGGRIASVAEVSDAGVHLAQQPTANDHATRKDYVDGLSIRQWTAGVTYVTGNLVRWDNLIFRVRQTINNAPANPDYTTIEPYGYDQSDFWQGAPSATNYAVGNWILLATVPAYGSYRLGYDAFGTAGDMSFALQIATSYGAARAVVLAAANPANLAFDQIRLSSIDQGSAVRVEARINYVAGSREWKITCSGHQYRANAANGVVIPKPPEALANGATQGGTERALLTLPASGLDQIYDKRDFWFGAPSATNYATGNWIQLVSVPGYGNFRLEFTAGATAADLSFQLDISTAWNNATMSVGALTRNPNGGIMFDQLRLSAVDGDGPYRIEGKINNAASANWQIHCLGNNRRGVTVGGGVAIPRPPQALAGGISVGGTQYQLINLSRGGVSAAVQRLDVGSDGWVHFPHANATNPDDGGIGARMHGRGLNIVGSATESGDTQRYIRVWGRLEDENGVAYAKTGGGEGTPPAGTDVVEITGSTGSAKANGVYVEFQGATLGYGRFQVSIDNEQGFTLIFRSTAGVGTGANGGWSFRIADSWCRPGAGSIGHIRYGRHGSLGGRVIVSSQIPSGRTMTIRYYPGDFPAGVRPIIPTGDQLFEAVLAEQANMTGAGNHDGKWQG